MFPMTVTITDQAQLKAVLAVLKPSRSASASAQPVLDDTPRSDSAPSHPPVTPPPAAGKTQRAAKPAATKEATDVMRTPGYAEVANALTALSKELGGKYAQDVLESFGVKVLSKIPEKLFPEVLKHIEGFYIAHERGLPLDGET
ncbi:hypothetical protein [Xylella fastidiosa]|uniref:hypothetical protein n=1 Tax=Xylella fastidiosa TaxID=2371 RepID=UPI00249DCEEC|nr:hypothetical protein [Xylella fastidiosa]WGZ33575.1 hypothetical protein O4445_07835 [Xylella fastidiosa subsp. pauca]WGZ35897.1 hypothetical protein O4443_07805 [Xylella fastidiosa subsp. pauca]